MKKGLFSKMVAFYTVSIALSFIIIATFLSLWFQGYLVEQRRKQLQSQSELISIYAVGYIENNRKIPSELLAIFSKASNADIWLADRYGYVYEVSNEKYDKVKSNQVFTKEFEELRLRHTVEREGPYGSLITKSSKIYLIPAVYLDNFYGAIIMITPADEFKKPLQDVFKIIWVSAVFAMIISTFIIYYFSNRIIIGPLAAINHAAKKIAKGEVDKRVQINSYDEIGQLAESFNSMADNLEKVDKNRRDFISNVSHEIRSPITSIKGFIGGILDGVIPKEKENYYLSVTYEEIQRLTRLVNDLLDLSAIEAGQFKLRIEEFNINELIRVSVIKFETKIKAKKLTVEVLFNQDNLYVAGDRDRLVQVITNLIDNAIKYVGEGGNIKISTKAKGDKAIVSVFNDGPCIAKEDLSHIWDRFYKADKSRTTKMSTGLGLPIARNILTQHGEDIWVENKEGEGVTFTFTLKRI